MHVRGKGQLYFDNKARRNKKENFWPGPLYKKPLKEHIHLKKPMIVPKGSVINCINWFDNSDKKSN